MKILLLQARTANDPIITHERDCFLAQSGLGKDELLTLNLATEPPATWCVEADAIFMGGSGEFSVVDKGFDWEPAMYELIRGIVANEIPFFGSCFGFQVLVTAMGGEVRCDPAQSEIGTRALSLTDEGHTDSLFSRLPRFFDANLGHNDSATRIPEGMVNLASSHDCPFQAVRLIGKPIWATQFHPELRAEDNTKRYLRYLTAYAPHLSLEEARDHAALIHRSTPECNLLLSYFVEMVRAKDFGLE